MKNALQGMAARISRFRFNTEHGQGGLSETEGAQGEQTGGLKLMTVFIAVLALHLVVIGGISAWHFIKGPSASSEGSKGDAVANATPDAATVPDATTATTDGQTAPDVAAPATASKDTLPADGSEVAGTQSTAPTPAPALATAPVAPVKPVIAAVPKPAVPAPAPVAVAPATGASVYVVKSGDTLHHVAKVNGMTVAQLKEMNHLTGDMLRIGQKLSVKGNLAAPAAPAVVVATVAAPAPMASAPAPAAPVASGSAASYTVAKGDTLTKIAKQFKVTAAAIMAANSPKLSDPKKLKIGEVLTIPVKGDRHEVSQGQAPVPAVPTLRSSTPDLVMNK